MKNTFKMITLSAAAVITLTFAGQSFAASSTFTDLDKVPAKDKIISLQQSGLIKGITPEKFAPYATITSAQGVQLIVSALGLNLDLVRFVKEPKASDYFAHAKNDAWYANALITAAVNGLELPANLDPNKNLTREEFTHQLIHAIEVSGKLPLINPVLVTIKDQNQINVNYSGSIQRAINYKVIKLNADGTFKPKASITRAEAAEEIYNALAYIKAHPVPTAPAATNETLTADQGGQLIKDALGVEPKFSVDPSKNLTREEFTYELIHTMDETGKLPMIKPVVVDIKDNDQINIDYSGSIQRAINYGVIKLNADGTFNPKGEITLAEATDEVNNAVAYMKAHTAPVAPSESLTADQGSQLITSELGLALDLKKFEIEPSKKLTREEFTYLLVQTLQTNEKLPMIKVVPVEIKDNDQINVLYSGSVQTAIHAGIVKLSPEGNFNPKAEMTRADAADEINHAVDAIKKSPKN